MVNVKLKNTQFMLGETFGFYTSCVPRVAYFAGPKGFAVNEAVVSSYD